MPIHARMLISDLLALGEGAEAVLDWYGVSLDEEDMVITIEEVCAIYGTDTVEVLLDLASTLGVVAELDDLEDLEEEPGDWGPTGQARRQAG